MTNFETGAILKAQKGKVIPNTRKAEAMFGNIKTVYVMEVEGNKYFFSNEYDRTAALNRLSYNSMNIVYTATMFYEIDLATMTETKHQGYREKFHK